MASDTSTVTSVTASPLDLSDSASLPIELKIPLPPSRSPSNHDADGEGGGKEENKSSRVPLEACEEDTELFHPSYSDTSKAHGSLKVLDEEESPGPNLVSWDSLMNAVREEKVQRWHTKRLEEEVDRLEFANGLDRRLKDTLSIAYGNLIDQFKGDDQSGFTGIYEASERLISHCSRNILHNPEQNILEATSFDEKHQASGSSLPLLQLYPPDQDVLLAFINKLRTDLDYLADLISNLPSLELASLTSCYHPAGVDLSVLPNHSHGRTQAYSRDSQMMKLSRRMDNIDLLHHQDPYFTLLYNLFDTSAKDGSKEHALKMQVWANTCAKVMTTGKFGSEEFAIATIDSFVDTSNWSLKPQIEGFLLQVLAEGWFLLDPPEEDFVEKAGSAIEPERASHAIAVADFFDKYTRRLFCLLSESEEAVPDGVRKFIHATLRQIMDPQMKELAKKFIVSRWYFAIFLSSLLVYPEVQGLCLSHHIGMSARQQILNKLVVNLQSQVFSVLAPSSSLTFILPEVQDQVFHIMDGFDPPEVAAESFLATDQDDGNMGSLMLSQWDIAGIVETLHPNTEDLYQGSAGTTLADSISQTSSTTLRPDKTEIVAPDQAKDIIEVSSESADDGLTDLGKSTPTHGGIATPTDPIITPRPKVEPPKSLYDLASQLRSLSAGRGNSKANASIQERVFLLFQCSGPRLSPHLTSSDGQRSSDDPSKMGIEQPGIQFKEDYQTVLDAVVLMLASQDTDGDQSSARVLDPSGDLALSLEREIWAAKSQNRFVQAHQWWKRLNAYRKLQEKGSSQSIYAAISHDVFTSFQDMIMTHSERRALLESKVARLASQRRQYQRVLKDLTQVRNELRIKMWYSSDVKNSAPYEDALRVARALRAMANKKKAKASGGLANWAKQRLRGMTAYDRADKQVLEAMASPKDQGGLSKLGDEQIDLVSRWMVKNGVKDLCLGEERMHRFSYEVQKLVSKLCGMSLLETPVLWSSNFFRQEKAVYDARNRGSSLSSTSSPMTPSPIHKYPSRSIGSPSQEFNVRMKMPVDFSGLQISTYPQQQSALFGFGSSPYSTTLPIGQATGPLSPPMTPRTPRSSDISNRSIFTKNQDVLKAKDSFVEDLKKRLTALVNSDLGYILWALGSETDVWINRAVDQAEDDQTIDREIKPNLEASSPLRHPLPDPPPQDVSESAVPPFGFSHAYRAILESISLSPDPYEKLRLLGQLQELVVSSLMDEPSSRHPRHLHLARDQTQKKVATDRQSTSLEEVIVSCNARRASTLRHLEQPPSIPTLSSTATSSINTISPDSVVTTLLSIFRDPTLRPATLFRDLQLIASLLPASILDHTSLGLAFWNASLAALSLKEELLNHTVSRASTITEHHLRLRSATLHPPLTLPDKGDALHHIYNHEGSNKNTPSWLRDSTLKDAASLWLIAARERHPVAARELALFYLTHPDLLKRHTAPMARGRDVFSSNNASSSLSQAPDLVSGIAGVGATGGGPLDRSTFCVVRHWMEVAAKGGDREAADFLRENGGRV